jgi:archaellum component FlaC
MDTNTMVAILAACLAFMIPAILFVIKKGIDKPIEEVGKTARNVSSDLRKATEPMTQGTGKIMGAISNRINSKNKEMEKLRIKCESMSREVERLSSQKVDVSQIKPIFKLSLIETDNVFTDLKKDIIESKPKTLISRREGIEYLGVLQATYKQNIGVDLGKLKQRNHGRTQ